MYHKNYIPSITAYHRAALRGAEAAARGYKELAIVITKKVHKKAQIEKNKAKLIQLKDLILSRVK